MLDVHKGDTYSVFGRKVGRGFIIQETNIVVNYYIYIQK